jgi:hypothetical protein
MNKEIEIIGKMILRKHKENKGILVWHKNTFDRASNTTAAKELLIDLGLIKWASSLKRTTSLTERGWSFESFEKERQKSDLELEKMNLEIINLRNQLFDYEKIKMQKKVALIIASIATLAAILQILI